MKIIAEQKHIRISPRKIRLVASVIRGMNPQASLAQLEVINKRAAAQIAKVIKQALANAQNNFNMNPNHLRMASIEVNEGPTIKRWRAVSRGRAHSILKRTSHIKVILEPKPVSLAKPQTALAPAKAQEVKSETKTESVASKKAAAPAKKPAAKKTATSTKATKSTSSKAKKQ